MLNFPLAEIDVIRALGFRPQIIGVVHRNGKVLFLYNKEYDLWMFAQGGIDNGETIEQGFWRELKEELGIEAKEWIDLGLVNPFTTVVKSSARMFLARKLKFEKDDQEATENIKLVKVKLEKVVKMVMNNIITHGPSCVLILKADKYLKNSK